MESYTLHNLPAHAYSPTSTSTILTSGSTWQYLVTAGNPASDWKSNPGYDDTNPPWYGGPSPLGYGGQGAS
ncbi:hypothetical protein, partial [Spirosoma spitsbergense]|uniref:hypothetical protein n=1 Tax=Spirosoma spitsbergense TaxID=431554 RepID=UPI0012FAC4AC